MPLLRSDFHKLVIHQLFSAHSRCIPVDPFAPPALTGFVATMGLSDSHDAVWTALSFWDLAAHTLSRTSWVSRVPGLSV